MKCLVVGACFLGSVEAVDGSADRFVAGVVNEAIDSVRLQDKAELALLNNPGYMGLTQAVTVMGVTNFTGLFRTPAKYQTNVFINYEIARRPSLSWQFGFKSIQRTMDNADFSDYGTYVFVPSSGWGNSLNYKPYGTISSANNLTWSDYYSGQTLPSVGTAGVSGSLVSMSYGFGFRNVLFDQVGVVFEMTSGLTMLNSGGFSVYTLDNYTGNYHGVDQADVMRRVMLREFHKSQWLQFKLGVGY
ncbi:MAG: hypothetical protein RIS28_289, partial [Bacteroidota bacterium]